MGPGRHRWCVDGQPVFELRGHRRCWHGRADHRRADRAGRAARDRDHQRRLATLSTRAADRHRPLRLGGRARRCRASASTRRRSAGLPTARRRRLTRLDVRWSETALGQAVTAPGVTGASAGRSGCASRYRYRTHDRPREGMAGLLRGARGWTTTASDGTAGWQVPGGVGLDSYLSRNSVPLGLRVDDVTVNRTAAAGAAAAAGPPARSRRPPFPPPPVPPRPFRRRPSRRSTPERRPDRGRARPADHGSAGSVPVGCAATPSRRGPRSCRRPGTTPPRAAPSAPLRTLAQAIAVAPAGSTVVLRAGTFHESAAVPAGKRLTSRPTPARPSGSTAAAT